MYLYLSQMIIIGLEEPVHLSLLYRTEGEEAMH